MGEIAKVSDLGLSPNVCHRQDRDQVGERAQATPQPAKCAHRGLCRRYGEWDQQCKGRETDQDERSFQHIAADDPPRAKNIASQ